LRAPAKLNLYLKVINKRKDGYHNIVTLFERIHLFDDIQMALNNEKKIRIFCAHPQVPAGPKNLAYRMAHLLREDFALEDGVDIRILKRIPVAAGLAGGSSNAAAVLIGLNKLWRLSLTKSEMISYAKRVGADVAFFLQDCSWGVGTERGDRVKRLAIKTKLWHILVVPKVKVYSGAAYGGLNLQLTKKDDDVNILIRHLRRKDLTGVSNSLLNDLESSTFRLCPNIIRIKKSIENLSKRGAVLSGSGPAVFGLAESRQQAENMKSVLARRYSQVFIVRTL